MAKSVIVIGIDGASFDMIRSMTAQDELPNFKMLMDSGASGPLMSAYPPHTVPAWPVSYTGVNPGKLGIFDFRDNSHSSYDEGRILVSSDMRQKPIWKLLSERNRRVMVAAMPLTYPPSKVNGVMVSPVKMIEPDQMRTFPPELGEEIFRSLNIQDVLQKRRKFMALHTGKIQDSLETFLDTVISSSRSIIEKMTELVLYLHKRDSYDFSLFMLPIDALQHHLWAFHDQRHPSHRVDLAYKYRSAVADGYRWVDHALGKIIEKLGKDVYYILLSDHGFGPLYYHFNANRWLMDQGLLFLKPQPHYIRKKKLLRLKDALGKVGMRTFGSALPARIRNMKLIVPGKVQKPLTEMIDWKRTRAYATSYAININLKGREPEGIVNPGKEYREIIEDCKSRLSGLVEPFNNRKLFSDVKEREKQYRGPYVDLAPDLLVFFNDPKFSLRKDCLVSDVFRRLTPEDRLTGHHTSFPEGTCIISGPDIRRGINISGASLLDIAPTILYLLGEKVPGYMDGRVVRQAFTDEVLEKSPIEIQNIAEMPGEGEELGPVEWLDEEERAAIEEKLRQLGYMG